jgi:hypothetical protein
MTVTSKYLTNFLLSFDSREHSAFCLMRKDLVSFMLPLRGEKHGTVTV